MREVSSIPMDFKCVPFLSGNSGLMCVCVLQGVGQRPGPGPGPG